MSKDTIAVNMNVYDIPIVVEQLNKLEQENKQLKEEINKMSKKEVKVRDMLYSIENGTLTKERLMQIEEVLFELDGNNE